MNYNVAVIVDTLNGGGAEKVCITLVRTLCHLGHKACLIVVKALKDYELEADFPVCFLLEDNKAKLYQKKNIKVAAEALRTLAQRQGGFDLVLSNLDGAHPVVAKADLDNVWYVVHNSIEEKLKRARKLGPIKYFRQKAIFKIFNNKNLVCVSQGLRAELEHSKVIRARQVRCIYNPVDIEGLRSGLQQEFVKPDYDYIVHAGRFARMKRHDVLFSAMKRLIEKPVFASLKLVLLCEDSKKLRTAISKYGLENTVIVAGFVQNPYVWYTHASLLVLSSEAEGFGMVLVEAMLCGTRVVSTDCRHGPNEILTGELAHLLAPVGDASSLVNKMELALNNYPDQECPAILQNIMPEIAAKQYLNLI